MQIKKDIKNLTNEELIQALNVVIERVGEGSIISSLITRLRDCERLDKEDKKEKKESVYPKIDYEKISEIVDNIDISWYSDKANDIINQCDEIDEKISDVNVTIQNLEEGEEEADVVGCANKQVELITVDLKNLKEALEELRDDDSRIANKDETLDEDIEKLENIIDEYTEKLPCEAVTRDGICGKTWESEWEDTKYCEEHYTKVRNKEYEDKN